MAFGNKKEQQMTDSMSVAITEGITAAMRPVFEELTGQMSNMMAGLQNQQAESMKVMADAFLQEMKKAADGMFANITSGLEEAAKLQQTATANLNSAVDKMLAESKVMADAAKNLVASVNDIKNSASLMGNIATEQNKTAGTFMAQVEKYSESSERIAKSLNDRQNEWIDNYKNCDKKLADTTGKVTDTITTSVASLEKSVTELKKACEELNKSSGSYAETITSASQSYASTITTAGQTYGKKLDEGIQQTFETFDKEMAGIVTTLGAAATNISEVTAQIPRTLKGSIDELERTIKR